jgi:hypothetical protein
LICLYNLYREEDKDKDVKRLLTIILVAGVKEMQVAVSPSNGCQPSTALAIILYFNLLSEFVDRRMGAVASLLFNAYMIIRMLVFSSYSSSVNNYDGTFSYY